MKAIRDAASVREAEANEVRKAARLENASTIIRFVQYRFCLIYSTLALKACGSKAGVAKGLMLGCCNEYINTVAWSKTIRMIGKMIANKTKNMTVLVVDFIFFLPC